MLDKILPIHEKCLYLQYANNLNINKMKAIELFDAYIREALSNEQSGIVDGESIICAGPFRLFGVHDSGSGVLSESKYLYSYLCPDWSPGFLPIPDLVLGNDKDVMHVFLWKLEN